MKAEDLVGKRAIRRSAVILCEEKKIMDPSYMDPNKPVTILKYDYSNNAIVLRTHDGIGTILTREYDDDKWVEITKESKYKDIYYPVGYHSVLDIYRQIDKRTKLINGEKQENKSSRCIVYDNLNCKECTDIIAQNALYKSGPLLISYSPSDTGYNSILLECEKDQYDVYYGCLYIEEISTESDCDIRFTNCKYFTTAIDNLLKNNVFVIKDLNIIPLALASLFGYDAINRLNYMPKDEPIKAFVLGCLSDFSVVFNESNEMSISYIDLKDTDQDIFINSPIILLGGLESEDLHNKIRFNGGTYECDTLLIQ